MVTSLTRTNPVNVPLEISHDESKNVIKVYYVKDSFKYSVEYYFDGIIDSSMTVTGTANFKDIIDSYTDKVIDGYKLEKTENLPLTISSNKDANVIRVYYVKNEFGYSVHYFYDGTEDTSKLETGVKTFGETIGYTDKVIDGYRLDYTDPASGEITISVRQTRMLSMSTMSSVRISPIPLSTTITVSKMRACSRP